MDRSLVTQLEQVMVTGQSFGDTAGTGEVIDHSLVKQWTQMQVKGFLVTQMKRVMVIGHFGETVGTGEHRGLGNKAGTSEDHRSLPGGTLGTGEVIGHSLVDQVR